MPTIDQVIQRAQVSIATFNKDYEKTPFAAAGKDAAAGLKEFVSAAESFKHGDSVGGSSSLLKGIGSFASAMAIAGPAGAAAGALLAAITGLISAILDAMKPAMESLESKIEKLLVTEDLTLMYGEMQAGNVALSHVMQEIENQEGKLVGSAGMTYAQLTGILNPIAYWAAHEKNILKTMQHLKSFSHSHSREWMPLFDITVAYALRYWLVFESIAALIVEEDKHNYLSHRKITADAIKNSIENIYLSSLNEADFYHLTMGDVAKAYPYDVDQRSAELSIFSSLALRTGLIDGGAYTMDAGKLCTFAPSTGGTLFLGATHSRLYYGRGNNWVQVLNCPGCEQVFIGEHSNNKICVVCVHDSGRRFSFAIFDDTSGSVHENGIDSWSTGDWRWGKWCTYDVPEERTILTMAIQPVERGDFAFWAFVLAKGGGAGLSQISINNEVKLIPVHETWLPQQKLQDVMFNVSLTAKRWEISPCTISLVGETIFLHVGNQMMIRELGKWVTWELQGQDFFWDPALNIYQARAFADGSLIFATNKGLYARYTALDGKLTSPIDTSIKTLWFWKQCSDQAVTVKELYKLVASAGAH